MVHKLILFHNHTSHFRMKKPTLSIKLIAIIFIFVASCSETNHKVVNGKKHLALVKASAETSPVKDAGDAADDPAIWLHQKEPARSTIIGTDKKKGLLIYNLKGKILFNYPIGRINNVDIRYNFQLNGESFDIAGASNRTDNTLVFYKIEPDSGKLIPMQNGVIKSQVKEVYGFALYHNIRKELYYAFVNSKNGEVEQWALNNDSTVFYAEKVRSFKINGQTEGMVADDELGYLYIGQEDLGIWKLFADPGINNDRFIIADTSAKYISPDIEGLTIYYASDKKGYLIASIQGQNTFAIFERDYKNKFIGCFGISRGKIDGASETDGIDVTNFSLGKEYPDGIFVAQDGFNTESGDTLTQNFKIVLWNEIASSFEPKLIVDNKFSVRNLSSHLKTEDQK